MQLKKSILLTTSSLLPSSGYRIFFFGSRVVGSNGERSDIDLGILGPSPVSPATMAAIREAIEELPILYPIDVVDIATVSDEFKKNAMQHVEYLN